MNRAVTYSLLAYINNDNKDLRDLADIFVPLVKRAIFNLNEQGITKGTIEDIKGATDKIYSLDIPYPILDKLVEKIANEQNTKELGSFIYYNDRSFKIKEFLFADCEEMIEKQENEIVQLEEDFNKYLSSKSIDISVVPTLYDFLDQNRISLSKFFAQKFDIDVDLKYLIHAQYLKGIENNDQLISIARKIYMGSIIASYLELNLSGSPKVNTELLFDTNFIISAVGLNSLSHQHTCLKILSIAKGIGLQLSVLDTTIQETVALIERKAEELNSLSVLQQLESEDIFAACTRLGWSRTDLQRMAAKIVNVIKKDHNITLVHITPEFIEKVKKTDIYRRMINRGYNEDGAENDAFAVFYVQEKRGKRVTRFSDALAWFSIWNN